MPGGSDVCNQRGAGGSGHATPPDGCVDPGQALAAGRCIGGGSGHWTWDCGCAWGWDWAGDCDWAWDCDCSWDGRMVMAVGPDSSFGLATTFGFGLGFGLLSALVSGSAACACAVGCESWSLESWACSAG